MVAVRALLAALALAPLGATAARAQDAAPEPEEGEAQRRVTLQLEDCLGADATAVRRIVAAELGEALVGLENGSREPAGGDVTLARADCGVESAIVVVLHPRTGVRFERRIDLANAAPRARARLLALSIAETVASTWSAVDALPPPRPRPASEPAVPEPAPRPPAYVEPPAPPPREAPPPPLPAPDRPLGVRVVGVARVSGSPMHVSGGGGLGLEIGLPLSLGVGVDFRYEQGEADGGDRGRVALRVAWGSLLALIRPVVDWSSVTIGAGAKLGVAWLEGLPAGPIAGRVHAGFVAGPALTAQVALHLAGSGYVHVGLELAWISLGVAGTDGVGGPRVASFEGPQLAVTAGFEIQPSR